MSDDWDRLEVGWKSDVNWISTEMQCADASVRDLSFGLTVAKFKMARVRVMVRLINTSDSYPNLVIDETLKYVGRMGRNNSGINKYSVSKKRRRTRSKTGSDRRKADERDRGLGKNV